MNKLRVLNTRPLHQADVLDTAILDRGGVSINVPALSIHATASTWLEDMPDLIKVDHAIFISANAVNYFFTALKRAKITWPANICTMAVGQATAHALSIQGITPRHIPLIADSEHLLKLEPLQTIGAQTILLIKGVGGRPLITETLLSRGAFVVPLSVYSRGLPDIKQDFINSLWQDNAADIILFTSQQAMHHFFSLFSEEGQAWIRSKPCLVISPRLAEAASALKIRTIIICQYDKVVEALSLFSKQGFLPFKE